MASKVQDTSSIAALVKQKRLPWWVKGYSEQGGFAQATFSTCACGSKNAKVRLGASRTSDEALTSVGGTVSYLAPPAHAPSLAHEDSPPSSLLLLQCKSHETRPGCDKLAEDPDEGALAEAVADASRVLVAAASPALPPPTLRRRSQPADMLHSPPPTPPREKKRVHALESAAADVVFATALQQVTMQAQIDKLTSDLAVMSAKSTRDEEELIQLRALSRSSASAQGMKTDREAQEAGQFDDADVSMFDDADVHWLTKQIEAMGFASVLWDFGPPGHGKGKFTCGMLLRCVYCSTLTPFRCVQK